MIAGTRARGEDVDKKVKNLLIFCISSLVMFILIFAALWFAYDKFHQERTPDYENSGNELITLVGCKGTYSNSQASVRLGEATTGYRITVNVAAEGTPIDVILQNADGRTKDSRLAVLDINLTYNVTSHDFYELLIYPSKQNGLNCTEMQSIVLLSWWIAK